MDAKWVAARKTESEERRMGMLRRLLTFVDGELSVIPVEDDGVTNDSESKRRTILQRRDRLSELREVTSRMLNGTSTETDEFAMVSLLRFLEISMQIGHDFPDGIEMTEGCGAMESRFLKACGTSDITGKLLPRLVPSQYPSQYGMDYDRYLDETIMLPRGNYVITDPCYLLRTGDGYESLKNALGVFAMRDTLYGDWGCTLCKILPDGGEVGVGRFCADAGLVCVADWDDAMSYNPDVAAWPDERPWTMAIIRDFEGTAEFRVTENWWMWQYPKKSHIDYKLRRDYELKVVFEGVICETGEQVTYEGKQTSL